MISTSAAWKANQLAQLRSESLIRLSFSGTPIIKPSATGYDIQDWRAPYATMDTSYNTHSITYDFGEELITKGFDFSFNSASTVANSNAFTITFYLNGTQTMQYSTTNRNKSSYSGTSTIHFDQVIINVVKDATTGGSMTIRSFQLHVNDFVFDKNDVINFRNIQEGTIINNNLPTQEIEFTIADYDKAFDPDDPTSNFFKLYKNEYIKLEYGYVINGSNEYRHYGDYYLKEWNSNRNNRTITFKAGSLLDTFTDIYDKGIVNLTSKTYSDLIDEELTRLGYWSRQIDTRELAIDCYNPIPKTTFAEVLQIVSSYCRCYVACYSSYDIVFGQTSLSYLETVASQWTVNGDNLLSLPEVSFDKTYGAYSITSTDYAYGNQEVVDQVIVLSGNTGTRETYLNKPYCADVPSDSHYYQTHREYLDPGTNQWVLYSTSNEVITSDTTSYYAKWNYYCYDAGTPGHPLYYTTRNTLYGTPYTTTDYEMVFVKDSSNPNQLKINQPLFTSNVNVAANRGLNVDWIHDYYSHNEIIECKVRIDPALELFDVITIYNKKCVVEKIDLTFNGAYLANIKARRLT